MPIVTYECDGCGKHFGFDDVLSYASLLQSLEVPPGVQRTPDVLCVDCREHVLDYWVARQGKINAATEEHNKGLAKQKRSFFAQVKKPGLVVVQ